MQTKEKILDDLARVAGGAASVFGGFGRSVRADMKSRIENIANDLDLVPREDLERLEAMVKSLEARVAALEGAKTKKKPAKKKK